jgi:hypothetical protein
MPSLKLSFEQLEQKFVTSRCGTVHRLSFVASATTALLHEVWTPGNLMDCGILSIRWPVVKAC